MGDVRFEQLYIRLRDADDPLAVLRSYEDEDVIAALAAAPRREDPYLVNVLATEALNRSGRLRATTRIMGDAVTALDERGRIVFANPAAHDALAWPREALMGTSLDRIHVPHGNTAQACAIVRAQREKRTVESDDELFRTRSGRTFPVRVTASPVLTEDDVTGIVLVFHDVTARKQRESRARDVSAMERVIARVSRRLVAPRDLDDALDVSLRDMGMFRGARRAFLHISRHGDALRERTHEWCAPGVPSVKDHLPRLANGEFAWWTSRLADGGPLVVDDVAELPEGAAAERREFQEEGATALLAFPVRVAGETSGFLGFHHVGAAREWTDTDMLLTGIAADVVGHAVEAGWRERELRLLAHCMNHGAEAVALVDHEGRFRYVNQQTASLFGWSREELLRMRVHDVDADATDATWTRMWDTLARRGSMTIQTTHRTRDGGTYPAEVRVTRFRFDDEDYALAFVRDTGFHEERVAQATARAERYLSLFEHNPDAVYAFDTEGRATATNAACQALTGYTAEELQGMSYRDLVAPDDHEHARNLMVRALRNHMQYGTVTLVRKDGTLTAVRFTMIPIRVAGRAVGAYGVARALQGSRDA